MHAAFIPYGKSEWVRRFLRDIEAQKYPLPMTGPNGEKTAINIEGQLRVLPFGIYEHVFPKEFMPQVLTTLQFTQKENYIERQMPKIPVIGKSPFDMLRKALNLKKPAEFDSSKSLFWVRDFVSIIPIGIREDGEITEPKGAKYEGYTHEAI